MIRCTDAFEEHWKTLSEGLGLDLALVPRAAEAAGARPLAVVLACAGDEGRALDRLHEAHRAGVEAPIVVGAEPDHRLAVELMRAGAAAYYALPGDAERLEREVRARLDARAEERPARARADGRFDFSTIVGDHPSLRESLDRAARVIPGGRTTVLILGETGTGKELLARAIHDNGPRAGEPFVAINCSAIPATLLESELFGHEKGAFTDAGAAKPGLFAVADGGTIFLDEISAMPLELQGKLLRFLETREVRRLGGLRTTSVDVRVLAAANVDLRGLIGRGEFREDLYYRLAVVPIALPPLRERGDDVPRLARHFLARLADAHALAPPELSRDALRAIERHPWPGNVRELRNAIERGMLLCDGKTIRAADLALSEAAGPGRGAGGRWGADAGPLPFPATLAELERAATVAMIERCGGNKSEAARRLGITRSRLYRIVERARDEGEAGG